MTTCRLVIFDFDGTLADSAPWFISTLNDMSHMHGFRKVSEEEIEMLRGRSNREIVRFLGIRFWQMPAIARALRERSASAAHGIALFEGVPGLLQDLSSRGIMTAIVSSNGEETVRRVLGPTASLIDCFACGVSMFGKAKRFSALRRRLKLGTDEILAVGDEDRDVEAAHKAGIASVAVTWGYASRTALERCRPTFLVDTVPELLELAAGSSTL